MMINKVNRFEWVYIAVGKVVGWEGEEESRGKIDGKEGKMER
jgi:hypothetical protein